MLCLYFYAIIAEIFLRAWKRIIFIVNLFLRRHSFH